ncbi:hypothetical protein FHR84_000712 [Actinopolyspora biskrensis]|uniref:Uncharacterized protein n=1 Tax=Actinopolyspora biskrensis TaxID=1470178 RepID=A0A852YTW5_9ACTN|nr:hypothetical protein [Actinopolyspora biskrensis]NYH77398.1 hypothetical protein [Actinopolyspora biskrensis]
MELTRALLRFAAGRPHVLLLEFPGGTAARLAVEAELRRRGWPAAASPAETDVLVLTGPVGAWPEPLLDRLWRQVPEPRVLVRAESSAAVPRVLERARRRLATGGEARESSAGAGGHGATAEGQPGSGRDDGSGHGDGSRAGSGPAGDEDARGHGGADEQGGGQDHGHHHGGGHGHHHGGGAELPGGLAMADRGPDRDGLRLDQLHVPLGPLLPDWPPGLVVHTTLQGDVVQRARVEVLRADGGHEDFWSEPRRRAAAGQEVSRGAQARRRVAAYLDGLAGFLRVAGWSDPAFGAGALRDEVLAGARVDRVRPRLRRLARRLRRAWTLRRLTDGIGVLPPDRAEDAGFGGPVLHASRRGGDVTARWRAWLSAVERALPDLEDTGALSVEEALSRSPRSGAAHPAPVPAVLPELLEGCELATARLIVASLGPEHATPDSRSITEASGG